MHSEIREVLVGAAEIETKSGFRLDGMFIPAPDAPPLSTAASDPGPVLLWYGAGEPYMIYVGRCKETRETLMTSFNLEMSPEFVEFQKGFLWWVKMCMILLLQSRRENYKTYVSNE